MKTKQQKKLLLFFITLLGMSCVPQEQDPCKSTSSSSVSSTSLEEKCDDGSGTRPLPGPNPNPGTTDLNSLNRPWERENTTIVIDAYEGNSIDWTKMATDKKIAGVIHRSSIGMRVDKLYNSRKETALRNGYLWGAYHLGRPGNTIAQAKLFLSLVKNEPNTLMILDLEETNSGKFMSISEAIVFMEYVYEQTGRIPVVYANHSVTNILNQRVRNNPVFQQAKLWYARFRASIPNFPGTIWPNYFLWQFSSEINCSRTGSCLYNVPGTRFDMDVNVYNGSAEDLKRDWNNN